MTFLGHVVFGSGNRVDSAKIEMICGWPRPTSLLEIRSYIRLVKTVC